MLKKILIGLAAVLVIIQFIPAYTEYPEVDESKTFFAATNPPGEVLDIMKGACMDCHSHQTAYPWYAHVAPVNFWIAGHIDEGLEHFNLSTWADYDTERKDHKLEEFVEEIEEKNMPLESYTWMHDHAQLTDEQRDILIGWAKAVRETRQY